MDGFSGFPQKGRLVKVPGIFFSDLLPQIDHLGEMKVTLYAFWRLQQKEGNQLFLRKSEFLSDADFMDGLGSTAQDRRDILESSLERAVFRGTLLLVQGEYRSRTEAFYFMNTARGRALVEGLEENKWKPDDTPSVVMYGLKVERPNSYTLYEQNIGALTPLIADHLRDMEETYTEEKLQEAITIAAEKNIRKIKYIEGILKGWQERGRVPADQPSEQQKNYRDGKYGDEIDIY